MTLCSSPSSRIFRWYERDCLTVEDWLPLCVHTHTSQFPTYEFLSMKIEGAAHDDFPDDPDGGWTQREQEKQKATKGSAARVSQSTKPVGLDTEFSREIFDLVCTCNLAARKGHGEVVWFGYNVSEKKWTHKKGFVGYGSQGVCFTKGSARVLQMSMTRRTPMLFDMWLKEQLCQDFDHPAKAWQSNLRESCYISPPLGGFYEHETEIVGPGKSRPSLFGAYWGQEGSVGAVRPTDALRTLRDWPNEHGKEPMGNVFYRLPPFSTPSPETTSGRRWLRPTAIIGTVTSSSKS